MAQVFQRPRTISIGIYDYLRDELMMGNLAPGTWLREQELAARLNVSRTPVREAVRALAQEGFLDILPNHGVQVHRVTFSEAVDIYKVREHLEAMAVRLATKYVQQDDISKLELYLNDMVKLPSDAFAAHILADNKLHAFIGQLSNNKTLEEMVQLLNDRATRIKVLTRDINTTAIAHDQHSAIIDAIAEGDVDRAEAAMRTHIKVNLEIIHERIDRSPESTI